MRADAGRQAGSVSPTSILNRWPTLGMGKGKGKGEGFKGRGCVCLGDRVWEIGSVNRGRRGFFSGPASYMYEIMVAGAFFLFF